MTLWVSEMTAPIGSAKPGPANAPFQSEAGSTVAGALSTFNLSTRTNLIRLAADAVGYLLFTSSTSGTNATSTNMRLSANAPAEYFLVAGGSPDGQANARSHHVRRQARPGHGGAAASEATAEVR